MQTLSVVLVAVLSVTALGCKKKGGDADCEKALDRSMELSKAEMSKMPGVDDKMLTKMRDLGVAQCKQYEWSGDVRTCMVNAKTMADSQACYGKLTRTQQDNMNKAAMELAAPAPTGSADVGTGDTAEGTVVPDTAAGSAATGSAAGSAAAGSAAAGSAAAGSAAAPH